jgi:hypothetical protein
VLGLEPELEPERVPGLVLEPERVLGLVLEPERVLGLVLEPERVLETEPGLELVREPVSGCNSRLMLSATPARAAAFGTEWTGSRRTVREG